MSIITSSAQANFILLLVMKEQCWIQKHLLLSLGLCCFVLSLSVIISGLLAERPEKAVIRWGMYKKSTCLLGLENFCFFFPFGYLTKKEAMPFWRLNGYSKGAPLIFPSLSVFVHLPCYLSLLMHSWSMSRCATKFTLIIVTLSYDRMLSEHF